MKHGKMLITGGAGFIGYHCSLFFSKTFDLVIVDNLSRKGSDFNLHTLQQKCTFIFENVDVCQTQAVEEVYEKYGPFHVVLHLAAQVAVTLSVSHPREDFMINALGTFNVLDAFRRWSPEGVFLFASTNKVYGALDDLAFCEGATRYWNDNFVGISEERNLDFHSPYGCSKGAADQYVVDYGRIYGLRTAAFRQSCIYGTQQFGVEDQGWVAWFIIAGVLGRPITIYGNGKQVRDLLYVDDLIELYHLAIQNRDKFLGGRAYNVGGGPRCSLSLLELVDMLREHGMDLEISLAQWRPGDQKVFVSANARVQEEMGWEPRIKPEEGVTRIIHWVQENREVLQGLLK